MYKINLDKNRYINIHNNRFSVYSDDIRLFSFNVASRLNLAERTDFDTDVNLSEYDGETAVWTAESTVWNKKQYKLRVVDNCFIFSVIVEGKGVPENIEYFRGTEGSVGSNFAVAGYLTVNSQNKDRERSKFMMDVEPAEIIPLRAAPPPFVFPMWNDLNDDWIGIGIAAPKGKHNFQKLTLNAPRNNWDENGCWFTVDFEGYTSVDGEWESPYIWGGFGADDMDVLHNYADWQYNNLGFGRNPDKNNVPDWWKGPIFCGWGAQGQLRDKLGRVEKAPAYATEENYNRFIEKLEGEGLSPKIIMIDDKWQNEYGLLDVDTQKWSDMRAFADRQHAKGRRVVLWLMCWRKDGLPADECIMLDGEPYCADPTNPKYLARLEKAIYTLLSDDEGCMNCDGFKIDFMDCFPRMAGSIAYKKGVYGLEMQKRLFDAIYRFSKKAKSDALINMSSVHPYFSENCDQFRIHDFDPNLRSYKSTMQFRAEFAEAIMPGVLIDMDGFSGPTVREKLHCLVNNARLGVPDLYYLPDEFTESDWAVVRKAWDEYSENT